MNRTNMSAYGLNGQYDALGLPGKYEIGRILSQEKGLYTLISEHGEHTASVSGKLRYTAANTTDFPAVGDFVIADKAETSGNALIHDVLPRKSVFTRRAAGTEGAEQVIAANIDTVFICMSLNKDFNIRRLERYLTASWESGAVPVIVLTKSDLCNDVGKFISMVNNTAFGTDIITTCADETNVEEKLLPYIGFGKTVSFIGSSGVGKSTLINCLLGEKRLATGDLRNDDKGHHTTTRRQLFLLKDNGAVIDTPGMRELGLTDANIGLERTFSDIDKLSEMCRFRDCTHGSEPGCAVRNAIEAGALSMERFNSYRKLKSENAYFEGSEKYLAEKKLKFKGIAKLNKDRSKLR